MNGWRRWWEAWTSRAVVPLTPADRECYFRIAGVARTVAIAVLGGAFMWFVRDEPTWFLALTAVIVFPGTVVTWVMISSLIGVASEGGFSNAAATPSPEM